MVVVLVLMVVPVMVVVMFQLGVVVVVVEDVAAGPPDDDLDDHADGQVVLDLGVGSHLVDIHHNQDDTFDYTTKYFINIYLD